MRAAFMSIVVFLAGTSGNSNFEHNINRVRLKLFSIKSQVLTSRPKPRTVLVVKKKQLVFFHGGRISLYKFLVREKLKTIGQILRFLRELPFLLFPWFQRQYYSQCIFAKAKKVQNFLYGIRCGSLTNLRNAIIQLQTELLIICNICAGLSSWSVS